MVGADREEAMKRKNLVFGGAAVLTAAAAIGAGVMVSSGAMAASGTDPSGVVMSMINVGGDGSAITCKFSAADLPLPAPPGQAVTGSGVGVGGGTVTATATAVAGEGVTVTGAYGVPDGPTFSIGGGTDGPVLVGSGPGLPADRSVPPGALQITGSVSADGTATAVKVNPDGSTSPLEVRDGTPEECAKALEAMKPATESHG
jgi:hypothetical protein